MSDGGILATATAAATAGAETMTAAGTALTATAVETAQPLMTAAPDAVGFDLTSPLMVAMYLATVLAAVTKVLLDWLAYRTLWIATNGKMIKRRVLLVQTVIGAVATGVAVYGFGWPAEIAAVFAGGAYGSNLGNLMHRSVFPKPRV